MKYCGPEVVRVIFAGLLVVLDRGLVVLHALNDDCVTRVTSWFPGAKLNTIMSPTVKVWFAAQLE